MARVFITGSADGLGLLAGRLLLAQGHDVLYYENIEGGHEGAADNRQLAYMSALTYAFLVKELFAE